MASKLATSQLSTTVTATRLLSRRTSRRALRCPASIQIELTEFASPASVCSVTLSCVRNTLSGWPMYLLAISSHRRASPSATGTAATRPLDPSSVPHASARLISSAARRCNRSLDQTIHDLLDSLELPPNHHTRARGE